MSHRPTVQSTSHAAMLKRFKSGGVEDDEYTDYMRVRITAIWSVLLPPDSLPF